MSLEDKKFEDKTVDRLMDEFSRNLDVDDILAKCLSKELITENDMSRIGATFSSGNIYEAVRDLMLRVKRSPPGYLETFCGILADSKSRFLVPYIVQEYDKQLAAKKKPPIPAMLSKFSAITAGGRLPHTDRTTRCLQVHSPDTIIVKPNSTLLDDDQRLVDMARPVKCEAATSEDLPDSRGSPSYQIQSSRSPIHSNPLNPSVAITERYFHLVYKKYGVPFPEDASWKEVNEHEKLRVPDMLFEIADLFEGARVENLIKRCEKLRLNSGNVYGQFMDTVVTLLKNEITWGKVVVFFSFAVSFAIWLSTNEMSHLAARVSIWAALVLEDWLHPWIYKNGGWESLLTFGKQVKHKQAMTKLDQTYLSLGTLAVGTLAAVQKQMFS